MRGLKLSYIAQSAAASFNPAMTLMDQVCEAPIRHGVMGRAEAQAAAVQLFRELDLPNPETIGSRYPHQVSGGQLQRVMAAMAMIGRPEVIVFDEPTTALDVTTQVECLAAFRRLVREHGAAALYITHDLAVVAQIADRIMVLRRGKMVEFGEAPADPPGAAARTTRAGWSARGPPATPSSPGPKARRRCSPSRASPPTTPASRTSSTT